MILQLAGTSDARELAVRIQAAGHQVLTSVVTDSAAQSLAEAGLPVRIGRLTEEEMTSFLREHGITAVVDAAHPFAEEAHKNAMAATEAAGIPYIRYERERVDFAAASGLHHVGSYEEAAELARSLRGNIMLTTGSKTLQIFTERLLRQEGITLYARMLPRLDNMEKCAELGLEQKQIIAMQGPFSRELNLALYKNFAIDVVITKESGKAGSVDEKVETALELGLQVIVIGRPRLAYGVVYSEFAPLLAHLSTLQGGVTHGI